MHFSRAISLFTLAILAGSSVALQVSPNSPCSNSCLDDSSGDKSQASSSSTSGKDLSCDNDDYKTTDVGKKFQTCMTCLQTSSYESGGESDQGWFLYNARYTVDWCLYGFQGNNNPIDGPCITDSACKPLQDALELGNLDPKGATYDYCTANGSAFSADAISKCTECLSDTSDNSYLSNFIVALDAGCQQRPSSGTVLGLNQTIFSTTVAAITTPSHLAASSKSKSGLSTGAKIGIIIGGVIFLLIVGAIIFICIRKRRTRRSGLSSGYDPRFGAPDISAPNQGAYSNAYYQSSSTATTPGPIHTPKSFALHEVQNYESEKTVLTSGSVKKSRPASNETQFSSSISSSSAQPSPNPPPSVLKSMTPVPVHTAYIPNHRPSSTYAPSTTSGAPSPSYSLGTTSPRTTPLNSPPLPGSPPGRVASAAGIRRAPTPLAGNTNFSRDIPPAPRTGGSTTSARSATTSPQHSPRNIPSPKIINISGPQPQTTSRAESAFNRSSIQAQSHIDGGQGLIHPSLQSQLNQYTNTQNPLQTSDVPPRSESRTGHHASSVSTATKLLRLPTMLTKSHGAASSGQTQAERVRAQERTYSPDSPESVEQWPGSM